MAHVNGSGLQVHSIGRMYPLVSVPYQVGPHVRLWALLDVSTEHEITAIPSRNAMECVAEVYRVNKSHITRTETFADWLKGVTEL